MKKYRMKKVSICKVCNEVVEGAYLLEGPNGLELVDHLRQHMYVFPDARLLDLVFSHTSRRNK